MPKFQKRFTGNTEHVSLQRCVQKSLEAKSLQHGNLFILKLRCCCFSASEIQAAGQPVLDISGMVDGGASTGEVLPHESFELKPFQWVNVRFSDMLLTAVSAALEVAGYVDSDSGLEAEHQWDAVSVGAALWVGICEVRIEPGGEC